MRWGDSREVALRSIVAPGDVKERQASPHVVQLAEDIRELGGEPGNPLWVRKVRGGWQLIAGRDRYSALALLGAKVAPVRVVEDATPQELHDLEVSENLHRRVDDRDALIRERVRKVAERIQAARESSVTNVPKPGRPKSAEGEAREVVAAQLGTTPAAVKQAVHRAEAREEGEGRADEEAPEPRRPPPPIETFGAPLPPQLLDVPGLVRQFNAIDQAAREVSRKAADLGMFASSSPEDVSLIQEAAKALGALVRSLAPASVCPYCKAAEGVKCSACRERGWVTAQVLQSAPREKLGRAIVPVVPEGTIEFEPRKDPVEVRVGQQARALVKANTRRGPRVVVVNQNGDEHEVVDESEVPF